MSQLLNRKADQKLVAQYQDKEFIGHEADQWTSQGDADSFTEQVRDVATTRKGMISTLDMSAAHRTGILITGVGVAVLAAVTVCAAWKPEAVLGLALYGFLTATALGAVTVLLGIRRLREVQRLDDVFPSVLEADHVMEAEMTCKTLGEQRGSNGGRVRSKRRLRLVRSCHRPVGMRRRIGGLACLVHEFDGRLLCRPCTGPARKVSYPSD
jgi:hypothetical protein